MTQAMKIITVPDSRLRELSKAVELVDKKIFELVQRMSKTLVEHDDPPGVGLSAVQVGVHKRIFLTYLPKDKSLPAKDWNEETLEVKVFVNPEIVQSSRKVTLGGKKDKPFMEGCLSMPKIYGPVERHEWVKVRYDTFAVDNVSYEVIDHEVKTVEEKFSGFPARVVQHEQDHLDGILFTDRSLKQGLRAYREEGDEFVAIG